MKARLSKSRDLAVVQKDKYKNLGACLQDLVIKERGWDDRIPHPLKLTMMALVAATKCWVCGYINGYGQVCKVPCKCSISSTALIAGNYQNKVFWQNVNENCKICGKRRVTGGELQWCNCLLRCKVEHKPEMEGWRYNCSLLFESPDRSAY